MKYNFQKCREKRGLTQEEVSTALNISQGMVARIETGDKVSSWNIAVRLAELYNVPLDDFVERNENRKEG